MEKEQALEIIRELIEQAMSGGFFKKLNDLDIARSALDCVTKKVMEKKEENSNDSE